MAKANTFAALMAGLFIAAFAGQAHASVVYNLIFTATDDLDGTAVSLYNGTGTVTLSSTVPASGLVFFGNSAVTFLIDGVSFSGTAANVEFLNGAFYNAEFSQQVGVSPFRFDLQTSGVYAFYYANEGQRADGTIALGSQVCGLDAATPLPARTPSLCVRPRRAGPAWLAQKKQSESARCVISRKLNFEETAVSGFFFCFVRNSGNGRSELLSLC